MSGRCINEYSIHSASAMILIDKIENEIDQNSGVNHY